MRRNSSSAGGGYVSTEEMVDQIPSECWFVLGVLWGVREATRRRGADLADAALSCDDLPPLRSADYSLEWLGEQGLVEPCAPKVVGAPGRNGATPPRGEIRYLLSQLGEDVLRSYRGDGSSSRADRDTEGGTDSSRVADKKPRPRWDREAGELWVGDQLVKRFSKRAPNQQAILDAFEEEGWPACVYDPLPPAPDVEPSRRRCEAVRSLNKNHEIRLIRFRGCARRGRIAWRFVDES